MESRFCRKVMLSWNVFNAFWKLETVNRFTGTDSPSSSSSGKMLSPALPGLQQTDFIRSKTSHGWRSSKPLSLSHLHSTTISTSFSACTQHSIAGFLNWPDMWINCGHIFLQTAFIGGILDICPCTLIHSWWHKTSRSHRIVEGNKQHIKGLLVKWWDDFQVHHLNQRWGVVNLTHSPHVVIKTGSVWQMA